MKMTLAAVLTAGLLTLPVCSSFAADGAPPTTQSTSVEAGKGKRAQALERFRAALEQVDLTAEQKDKIKAIMSEARAKLQTLKGESDNKGQAREILQKARQDVMAVLTAEQKAKLREILQKARAQDKA